jgi:Flp pilus assembly protein TadG
MSNTNSVHVAGRRRDKGHAMVEVSLFAPCILFLFVGALDLGFYCYDLISTQNAARAAAAYTSSSSSSAADAAGACQYALGEMKSMANVRGLTSCDSYPLVVTAASVTGADGSPASQVSVSYRTDQLIPIPGLLAGRITIRSVTRIRVLQ